jgi:hypothetical protein
MMMLPVVLYGSEIWSVTLREERTFRVFEKRVLREYFGVRERESKQQMTRENYIKEPHHLYQHQILLG